MKFMACAFATLGLLNALNARCADSPQPAFSRDHATAIIANWRKIVSPRGIDERLQIPIGGANQWISVRGRDSRNPIILMIHGGDRKSVV